MSPSRVTGSARRDSSSPSRSESSFLSADSENTSSGGSQLAAGAPAGATPHQPNNNSNDTTSKSVHTTQAILPTSSRHSIAPPSGSYFSRQPGAPGIDPQLPPNRKAPASRSSHGIETKSGPPPALSTQRSYTGSVWRSPRLSDSRATDSPADPPLKTNTSTDSVVRLPRTSTNDEPGYFQSKHSRATPVRPSTSDGIINEMDMQRYSQRESEEDIDTTLRVNGQRSQRGGRTRDFNAQNQVRSSQEDLFFDLARDDSVVDEPPSRSERRRSRVGGSSFSQSKSSRPSSSGRLSTNGGMPLEQQAFPSQKHAQNSSFDASFHRSPGKDTLVSLRDTSFGLRSYAASAHPLDQQQRPRNARRSFDVGQKEAPNEKILPEIPRQYERRRSVREPSPGFGARHYKQSNLSYASNGGFGSSPYRSPRAYGDGSGQDNSYTAGTESTVSTTAPSTVWDELDDLKSRLRKLEVTGILPKSSSAAMSSVLNERPPTATTTMTTISSSPKRRQAGGISPELVTMKISDCTNVHPLLHSALAKAKPVLSANMYQVLEATASDALNLAVVSGGLGSQVASPNQASVVGSSDTMERHLRRKADNMCRSLTELCITLTEGNGGNEELQVRPGSRDTASTEVALPRPRLLEGTTEGMVARTSSRVMDRLEARRASLLSSSPLNGRRVASQEALTPTQPMTPVSGKMDKKFSGVTRNQLHGDEIDVSHPRRPLSRANTELGHVRPSPQTRISREYTSQHPLPSDSQPSPSTQSSIPTRKTYFSSTASSPLTPNLQSGNRRYLDRSTPPSSADSGRLAEARQRRIASLGQAQSRLSGISSGRLKQSESSQGH